MPFLRNTVSVITMAAVFMLPSGWCGVLPELASPDFILDTAIPRTDSDGDGMVDEWENVHGLNPGLDDRNLNPDGDAYLNIEEYNAGFDPQTPEPDTLASAVSSSFTVDLRDLASDQDGDGLPDDWEDLHGLNPEVNDALADPDNDGLTNLAEYNGGWNPQVADNGEDLSAESANFTMDTGAYYNGFAADTDGDGMPDWWEDKYGLNRDVDDAADNPDGDDLTNIEEYEAGRIPNLDDQCGEVSVASAVFSLDTSGRGIDSDGDGMPDNWESAYGLDPDVPNADEDPDNDGMTNLEEYNGGWNPVVAEDPETLRGESNLFLLDTGAYTAGFSTDTDGDGMPDWWEDAYGLSVTTPDATGNPDGDYMSNLQEYQTGGNPIVFEYETAWKADAQSPLFELNTGGSFLDTDSDGLEDDFEQQIIDADPDDDITTIDDVLPGDDFDGDGASNLEEQTAGTDPTDPQDRLVAWIAFSDDGVVIGWNGVAGRTYTVSYTTDLTSDDWHVIHGPAWGATDQPMSCTDDVDPAVTQRFYRIEVQRE